MQSKANTVPAYLREVPAPRRACLNELRRRCRAILAGYREGMHYGMPGYSRRGVVERLLTGTYESQRPPC